VILVNQLVMPAKAGIQKQPAKSLDASFRWHDRLIYQAEENLIVCWIQ